MVNYKRVVCEVAVLALLVAVTAAAPLHDCEDGNHDHYDQRQNGTDNYRVSVDGVVIAIAPADSLLAAVSGYDFEDLLDELTDSQKPKPPTESAPLKPEESKPDVKPQESKPEAPAKPEAPLSDVSVDTTLPETKGHKKDAGRKPAKGQRLKAMLANVLVPLLRRARVHDN